MIEVRADFRPLTRGLNALQRQQLPFAMMVALNGTAKAASRQVRKELPTIFDRPTEFTLNSNTVRPATKDRLEAAVDLRNFAAKSKTGKDAKYLRPQIYGGTRPTKRSEDRLRGVGILPAGKFLMPGPGAELDEHGNINTGQILSLLWKLNAMEDLRGSKYARKQTRGKRRHDVYFAIGPNFPNHGPGKLKPGIYQRTGRTVTPVFTFGSQPNYRPIFDFRGIVQRVVNQHLPGNFRRALAYAVRTSNR